MPSEICRCRRIGTKDRFLRHQQRKMGENARRFVSHLKAQRGANVHGNLINVSIFRYENTNRIH